MTPAAAQAANLSPELAADLASARTALPRADANAIASAERQRPATSRLRMSRGTRQRYGIVYQVPGSRKRHSVSPPATCFSIGHAERPMPSSK